MQSTETISTCNSTQKTKQMSITKHTEIIKKEESPKPLREPNKKSATIKISPRDMKRFVRVNL